MSFLIYNNTTIFQHSLITKKHELQSFLLTIIGVLLSMNNK